jgi:hypothetical protein
LREAQLPSVGANTFADESIDCRHPRTHEVPFPAESPVYVPKAGEHYQVTALPYRPPQTISDADSCLELKDRDLECASRSFNVLSTHGQPTAPNSRSSGGDVPRIRRT